MVPIAAVGERLCSRRCLWPGALSFFAVNLLFGVLAYQHSARVLGRTVLVRQPDSVLIDCGLDDLAVPIHAMDLAHAVGRIQQRIVL